jgi:hypothetical protein
MSEIMNMLLFWCEFTKKKISASCTPKPPGTRTARKPIINENAQIIAICIEPIIGKLLSIL